MKQCPSCNQGELELVELTLTHNIYECTNCGFLEFERIAPDAEPDAPAD